MANEFLRHRMKYVNDLKRSFGALIGIAQGIICDRQINEHEVHFLNDWLTANDEIAAGWPGDIVHKKVKEILADGIITEQEREHLKGVLRDLIGCGDAELAAPAHVSKLIFDDVRACEFPSMRFCLTGEFLFGPRESCEAQIEKRGGLVERGVTKKLHYLVVGDRGSIEWKHGSFGTKVEKAVKYKRDGIPILIVREDCWVSSLTG